MSLAYLFSSLTGSERPCLHRPLWRDRLGADVADVLERSGWLRNEGRADWYPCAGDCADAEQRHVMPDLLPGNRLQVVCSSMQCLDDEIPVRDLEQLSVDLAALALWLRGRLQGTGTPLSFKQSGVHGLGRVPWDDELREGVLAAGLSVPRLELLLRDLAEAAPRSVVFVPQSRILPMELRAAHGARASTMVVSLDDLLEVHGAQLQFRPRAGHLREPAAPPYQAGPLVGHLFSSDGERDLTLSAYNALVSRRSSFDLFIDMMTPGTKRGVAVGVRDVNGQPKVVDVAARAAAALVELVQLGKPLRVGQFQSVEVQNLDKIIERARRELEGEGRRGDWRFFHTISGVDPSAKSFVFRPQPGATFAVIVPLPG